MGQTSQRRRTLKNTREALVLETAKGLGSGGTERAGRRRGHCATGGRDRHSAEPHARRGQTVPVGGTHSKVAAVQVADRRRLGAHRIIADGKETGAAVAAFRSGTAASVAGAAVDEVGEPSALLRPRRTRLSAVHEHARPGSHHGTRNARSTVAAAGTRSRYATKLHRRGPHRRALHSLSRGRADARRDGLERIGAHAEQRAGLPGGHLAG